MGANKTLCSSTGRNSALRLTEQKLLGRGQILNGALQGFGEMFKKLED